MGTEESLKEKAAKMFGGLAAVYERVLDLATIYQDRYWKRLVAEETAAGPSDLILDVGAGTLLLEERLLASKCTMVGLDLTEEMLRVGKAKGLTNVSLLVNGDAEFLPFRQAAFDAVTSCYVAKYVDFSKFAEETARVVKPGGRVVLYDFVRPTGPFFPLLYIYIHGGIGLLGFILRQVGGRAAFTLSNVPHIVDESTWDQSAVKVMEKNGFETLGFSRLTLGAVALYSGRLGRMP
jgi:demethylmenaquinone methyltransferase / 2-methoxy-6-polyprenyl-1,4-benzoquinol methylase